MCELLYAPYIYLYSGNLKNVRFVSRTCDFRIFLSCLIEVVSVCISKSFEYLLTKDAEVVMPENEQSNTARSLLICIIAVCAVWLTTTVLFTFISTLAGNYVWQLFIWGVPLSSLAIALCNALWWKSKVCLSITASIFNWTSILGLYLLFASYNIWLLFVVGAPIQAIIILAATMPKKKG